MTQSQSARMLRGVSTMRHPRKVIDQERAAYEPRFGVEFADRVNRGSWLLVVGGWISVVGVIGMVVIGIAVLFATGSLPAVYGAMYAGFGSIVAGYILNSIGAGLRSGPIKDMSARIIAFDPKVTPAGAGRLIRNPQLYDRWMAQHPGFVAAQPN
jgi:hypothetical protein